MARSHGAFNIVHGTTGLLGAQQATTLSTCRKTGGLPIFGIPLVVVVAHSHSAWKWTNILSALLRGQRRTLPIITPV